MWAQGYYGSGYWAPTYFPPIGAPPAAIGAGAGSFRRERYYAAVWSRAMGLKVGGLVLTASRRVRLMEDLTSAQLPALFMDVSRQKMKHAYNQPAQHWLYGRFYLYVANSSQWASADMALNGLLDALQAAFAPDPGWGTQTLRDTVHAVWLGQDDEIEVFAGPNGERAAAIVPFVIEVFE